MTHRLGGIGGGKRRVVALALAGLQAGVVAGCNKQTSAPLPNLAPETELVSPRDSSLVLHHVIFYYFGGDQDGTPAYYQYILDTYPPSVATIEQAIPNPPAVGDPRWRRTDTKRLSLVLAADVLRADRHGDIGAGLFDRWHTLWVRAVDNEGAVDETPARRTVHAYTAAPRLWLAPPAVPGARLIVPATFVMNWDGVDPIGRADDVDPGNLQDPIESRWVLRRVQLDAGGQPVGFPDSLYDLPESAWSPWQPWIFTERQRAIQRRVVLGAFQEAFVFAVQGRDDGGAVTPKFDTGTASANNYSVVLVDGSLPTGPRLEVQDSRAALGPWTFDGSAADSFQVNAAGIDTLVLDWGAPVASHYGAQASDTRYGWDIADPLDDNQWTPWSDGRKAAPHALTSASPLFLIQCRDDIGQITTGRIRFLNP